MAIRYTRRGVLGAGAGIVSAGLAGCVGSGGSAGSDTGGEKLNAQASFFVVGDFARQVAGDVASVTTVVPIGQHGHGWEPGPDVQRDVLTADAFVYVTEGFQPWADDVISNIESDGAGVAVIESAAGIDLLSADEHDHEEGEHGTETGTHDEHENGSGSQAGHEGESSESHDDHGEDGHGNESDHAEDERETNGNTTEGDGHDHGGGGMDPHFWLDPRRAKQAVETVRQGLTDADPGNNDDAYADNAAAYSERLDELDETFERALGNAPRKHVLVAGHDAFSYLGARYGFTVHALTGLAPDDQPTPQDVSEAQSIVDAHGIEYVLAPQLESKRAANQLVAETSAREVLEVTPIPGTADEWERQNWGYVEIMEEVNLPSFRRALGAE